MKVVIFGPPGAGKGTQAKLIEENFGIKQLSTGDIFRNNIKNETELGKKVKSILDSGNLVPDDVVVELVVDTVQKPEFADGYILDGFPRTVVQAKQFDEFLGSKNDTIDTVVGLEVPEKVLIQRILDRGQGRADDTSEKIKVRLEVYEKETAPVMDYYKDQGLYSSIDGVGTIDEILGRISDELKQYK
jgi:adenylate kinase